MGFCPPGRMRLSFLQTAKVIGDLENRAQLFIARDPNLVHFKRFLFINSLVPLTTGPQALPKPVLHSAIYCFLFRLGVSSLFLKVIQ
jgi:hypothetical protein